MPYESDSQVPDYVPKDKRAQWRAVWNSAYKRALADGKSEKDAEQSAFAQANGVAGPNKKVVVPAPPDPQQKFSKEEVNYTPTSPHPDTVCGGCEYFIPTRDCKLVACGEDGIADTGWCKKFSSRSAKAAIGSSAKGASMAEGKFAKFIPFVKVDAQKRQVWGIVTAERPDKEFEVCDYDKSKPYYEEVIAEMSKATNGGNFFPLREMHGLSAAGKCVGFDFRDADQEIFMGFEVVDDVAWKKVEKQVYTGFSQGGSLVGPLVEDPVYKGCMRYVAKPSEVSLVDNPCLKDAHFTYVKTDGNVEIRKFIKTEAPAEANRLAELEREVALIKAALPPKPVEKVGKTKSVDGEDLPHTAFAYVGDPEDPKTWKLPIKFSTDAKTKSHIRNALARFNQTKCIPADKKADVHARIVAAAKQHGVDVEAEKAKLAAIQDFLRKHARISVNKLRKTKVDIGHTLSFLDDDLGRLKKGMREVSYLAGSIDNLSYVFYGVCAEQEWEGDADSPLPGMLAENVIALLDTLVEMAGEETAELREEVHERLSRESVA